jgi:hypothetical protein
MRLNGRLLTRLFLSIQKNQVSKFGSRAMGFSLVLFCTVFGDGTISGMTVEQQDAKIKD